MQSAAYFGAGLVWFYFTTVRIPPPKLAKFPVWFCFYPSWDHGNEPPKHGSLRRCSPVNTAQIEPRRTDPRRPQLGGYTVISFVSMGLILHMIFMIATSTISSFRGHDASGG